MIQQGVKSDHERKWMIYIYRWLSNSFRLFGFKKYSRFNVYCGNWYWTMMKKRRNIPRIFNRLNFANVAKVEGGKPIEPIPIFIASASGETLNLAVGKLYKKSEPPIFFGHVETFVLSQKIVRNHFQE